jgi:hypothetical protein
LRVRKFRNPPQGQSRTRPARSSRDSVTWRRSGMRKWGSSAELHSSPEQPRQDQGSQPMPHGKRSSADELQSGRLTLCHRVHHGLRRDTAITLVCPVTALPLSSRSVLGFGLGFVEGFICAAQSMSGRSVINFATDGVMNSTLTPALSVVRGPYPSAPSCVI